MLRVYKFITTPFAPVASMQYPAYPGQIPSSDDYYTTRLTLIAIPTAHCFFSSKLMITETTNEIFDNALYKHVTPHSVPYWIRVTVATRLATTGNQWMKYFAEYNSGTYNNQWMVVDYKLYTPGTIC